jgi:outer membrane protein OmpA-like peptidoglycan-associated protein
MKILKYLKIMFVILAVVVLFWFSNIRTANADDWFWYMYPSPQGYLYVEDPTLYRMWEAQYGERLVTVPGESVQFPFTETIYFGYGSCEVGSEYFKTIQGIADLIADNQATAVLGGHTDERGEADVNVRYGFCRVQSVIEVLQAFGIETTHLVEKSFGAADLLVEHAETETEHALNRRVTIDFEVITPGEPVTRMERSRIAGEWEARNYLGLWK